MAEQGRGEEAEEAARLREAAGRLAAALDAAGFFRAAAYAAMAADAVEGGERAFSYTCPIRINGPPQRDEAGTA